MAERGKNNREIFESWNVIQDISGPANQWPYLIRSLSGYLLRLWYRLLISAFVYVNELNPDISLECAYILQLGRDASAYRHFEAFLRTVFPNRTYNMYALNVTTRRYEYIDCTVRNYIHAPKVSITY